MIKVLVVQTWSVVGCKISNGREEVIELEEFTKDSVLSYMVDDVDDVEELKQVEECYCITVMDYSITFVDEEGETTTFVKQFI